VVNANVNPIVFQCYKTFWVFLTSLFFLIPVYINYGAYEFSWWGTVSAAGWIPSGLCTIISVPLIGVSMGVVINTAFAAILSFLVFWLALDSPIKEHTTADGGHYYLAPAYLTVIIVGMAGLVYAPRLAKLCGSPQDEASVAAPQDSVGKVIGSPAWTGVESNQRYSGFAASSDAEEPLAGVKGEADREQDEHSWRNHLLGMVGALGAGLFSAVQYAMVNIGKEVKQKSAGCYKPVNKTITCPDDLTEEFNNFGSWMISFGVGAVIVTGTWMLGLFVYIKIKGIPMPGLQFNIMKYPGSIAGLCWSVGNFFNTAAVVKGGNAISFPQSTACQLLTSGLWGIFFYGEIQGKAILIWGLFAAITTAGIILLGFEKDS